MHKAYVNEILCAENAKKYDAYATREIVRFMMDSNMKRKPTLYEKLRENKSNIMAFAELDDEVLYDLRYLLGFTYNELAEIFGISAKKIARTYQNKGMVKTDCRRQRYMSRYGMRTIDVDKFVQAVSVAQCNV